MSRRATSTVATARSARQAAFCLLLATATASASASTRSATSTPVTVTASVRQDASRASWVTTSATRCATTRRAIATKGTARPAILKAFASPQAWWVTDIATWSATTKHARWTVATARECVPPDARQACLATASATTHAITRLVLRMVGTACLWQTAPCPTYFTRMGATTSPTMSRTAGRPSALLAARSTCWAMVTALMCVTTRLASMMLATACPAKMA
mmetsp:Transcript_19386/g.49807  ORF Transcript_19386/g.49807 Transcript_19386/m.49807 type:complete len:218 (-) Transcript_19386:52-705(-)